MFVRCQQAFIVAPSLDESEASCFARRVSQRVDDILSITNNNNNISNNNRRDSYTSDIYEGLH